MANLTLERIDKQLGDKPVIRQLSLEVRQGELVTLLGPSGCGKTTTLKVIGGFLRPDAGHVQIGGEEITHLPPERRPTAMVFQQYALWPFMTVEKNVAFGLKLRKMPKAEVRRCVDEALDLVDISDLAHKRPGQISGGQQQRVALARALVLEPEVLLLDEPLSNLDAKLRLRVREEIRALQQRLGITAVLVTHDQDEALAISDRVAVMSHGVVDQFDTPDVIYREPETLFVAEFVGAMNFLTGRVVESGVEVDGIRALVPCDDARALDGRRYRLAVRPEDVDVGPDCTGIPARVVERLRRGHFDELRVDVEGVEVRAFTAAGSVTTETVNCRFNRVRAYPLDGDGHVKTAADATSEAPSIGRSAAAG